MADATRSERPTDIEAIATSAAPEDAAAPPVAEKQLSKIRVVFPSLVLCLFLAALDQTIVSTALPTISSQLHASSSEYSWVGTSYLLMTTTLTPCYGRLSDLLGRKVILELSILLFVIASALCGAAQNMKWLIACRAFQGIGGGGILSMSAILVGDIVPFGERAKYQGWLGGVWGVASVLGPILGGLLTDRASWRWCFFINLPTCALALVVLHFALRLPDRPRSSVSSFVREFDFYGLALLIVGLGCIVVGFEQATDHGFNTAVTIALLVVGAVGLVVSAVYFLKTPKRGIVPSRILRTRTTGALMLLSYLQAFSFLSAAFFLPQWWQSVKGVSATMSGVHLLPFSLMVSVASLPTGWFLSKYGFVRTTIRVGYAIAALGFGLMLLMDESSSLAVNEIFPMISAIGIGMSLQAPLILLQAAMPLGDMAATASSFMLVRSLGATTGISIAGSVLATRQSKALRSIPGYTFVGVPSTREEYQAMHAVEPAELRTQVLGACADSFKVLFIVYTAFLGACLAMTVLVKGKYSLQEQYVARAERDSAPVVLPVPNVPPHPVALEEKVEEDVQGGITPRSETTLAIDSLDPKEEEEAKDLH